MTVLRPLQLALCTIFGLGIAFQASAQLSPQQDHLATITYNPPEAKSQSNCQDYYTCGTTERISDVIHPYCCLIWQTDPYHPYCEEYDLWHAHCSSGADLYTNFTKYNRYFDESCNVDNTCY